MGLLFISITGHHVCHTRKIKMVRRSSRDILFSLVHGCMWFLNKILDWKKYMGWCQWFTYICAKYAFFYESFHHYKNRESYQSNSGSHEPFVISKGADACANTVVIIYWPWWSFGTGECCPYRSIHGETQTRNSCFLQRILAKALKGKNQRTSIAMWHWWTKWSLTNASVKYCLWHGIKDLK